MNTKPFFAGAIMSALFLSSVATAEPLRLSVTSGLASNHAVIEIMRTHFQAEVARRVAEAGAGEIVWDEMHAGTLTRMGGVLEAVEDDLSLFGVVAVNHEIRRLPLQNLTFQMPFTTEDCLIVGAAYQTVHSQLGGMTDAMSAARQTFLSGIASDGYNFISVQAIRNADEVRGLKVGMVDRLENWIAGVQGIPQRLPDDTMGARMEAGVLGAAVLPTSEMVRLGLKRDADHYTRTGFGSQVPFVLTVNTHALEALPDAVRTAVEETRAAFTHSAAQAYCQAGDDALVDLRAQGVRTTKLLKTRRFQWADSLPPMAQQWAAANDGEGRPGREAVEMFVGELRAAGVTLTRDWSRAAPPSILGAAAAKELSQAPAK
jgi:TRAP-type C4-dicarboxylate transport system substrate-binding protein